jgi:hypothetical protein
VSRTRRPDFSCDLIINQGLGRIFQHQNTSRANKLQRTINRNVLLCSNDCRTPLRVFLGPRYQRIMAFIAASTISATTPQLFLSALPLVLILLFLVSHLSVCQPYLKAHHHVVRMGDGPVAIDSGSFSGKMHTSLGGIIAAIRQPSHHSTRASQALWASYTTWAARTQLRLTSSAEGDLRRQLSVRERTQL